MRSVFRVGVVMLCFSFDVAVALTLSDTYRTEETNDTSPEEFAYVGAVEIAAPLGRYLLVRRGHDMCAIRFTSYRREKKNDQNKFFAEYDWVYIGDDTNYRNGSGHEKLSSSGNFSILGFHSFLLGRRDVLCGSTRLGWRYPIGISHMGGGGVYLKDVQIAITPWRDLPGELDEVMRDLNWLSYDGVRRPRYFRLDDLPETQEQQRGRGLAD